MGCFPLIITQSSSTASIRSQLVPASTIFFNKRSLHLSDTPLPPGIRIATDGHSKHVLGTWIGNNIDQAQPWSATLDKIKNALENCMLLKPTLDVKHLIIQIIVGGMTRFLAKAQGMPTTVMKSLQ